MKKVTAMLLTLCMLFALAACGYSVFWILHAVENVG